MTRRRTFIKGSAATLAAATFGHFVFPEQQAIKPADFLKSDNDEFWKAVRARFPLTDKRIYLNNGTIGPSPHPVLQAVREKMEYLSEIGEYKGQEDSRQPVAELLGVAPEEISLTHNTTEGINIVAAGLPLGRGDEVIMTSHEHAGNALPWLNQKKYKNFRIRVFDPGPTIADNLNRINDLITSRTRVIAIPHITCTTGHKFPVTEIVKLAKDKGIRTFFDGAHGPGSIQLDMKSIGCDFYASCGHKWLLGPLGTGFLYINNDSLEVLKPYAIGAYSDTGWEISTNRQMLNGYVPNAHRFDFGTQSAPLANGLKAAVDFMNQIGMKKIESYTRSLSSYLYNQLQSLGDKVELLSPPEEASQSTMTTFKIPGTDYRKFGKYAAKNKFRIRFVPESGLDAIRISTHIYNNKGDVEKFFNIVSDYLN